MASTDQSNAALIERNERLQQENAELRERVKAQEQMLARQEQWIETLQREIAPA